MANMTFGIRELAGDGTKVVQNVQRRRVECGALPNATSTNTPHGITGLNLANVMRIWGYATDGATLGITLPQGGALASAVQVQISPTQVVLTTGGNMTAFTSAVVFIEYIP